MKVREMIVIPAIDLKGGRCVRLTQGRKEDATVYGEDAAEIARRFERGGARTIHVIDLDAAFSESNSPNRRVAREIVEAVGVPVQFGGGMRSVADVREALGFGAARVVVGTAAVESPDLLAELVKLFGERIAVGIDARGGRVVTRGWERQEEIAATELARRVARAGVARIVYTDVSRDGTLGGVNVEQTCEVARACGRAVTASGGVSSLEDIARLREASACGIDSVVVGKALYEGRFTLAEAIRAAGE
ncbi:MAG: 1-(5-phosphoribosyl)-5-[(5-phosphoribosylamino)methylideneamino]imidazole-4-carboxamide isomerase [Acidobacteriota bacterium]|nr:1-(5-phosphoribosyl)-5-[(5-phosphoribosylamino)methylideneamino]imidazole-4-carboxamide isomerase [Acidobacteriota bacterium]